MKKMIEKPGGGLIQALIAAYIATFALSLAAGFIIINMANKRFVNDTYNYNTALINKVKESIDPITQDIELYAKSLQNNPEITELMQQRGMNLYSYDELMPLIKNINTFKAKRKYIKDIYIYCGNSNLMVGDSIYPIQQIYGDKLSGCSESFAKWEQDYLYTNHYLKFIPEKYGGERNGLNGLDFVNTLYKDKNTAERIGVVIIRLNISLIINDIFMDEFSADSSFYVLSREKVPLVGYNLNQKDIDEIPYIDINNNGRIETAEKRIITFSNSGTNNWIYAVGDSKATILKDVYIIRIYFGIIILLYVLVGIILVSFGIGRSRRNVASILNKLDLRKNISRVNTDDILSKIGEIKTERREFESRVRVYDDEKKSERLMKFISGEGGGENRRLPDDITLPEQNIRVMIMRISDSGIFDTNNENEKNMPALCLINVLDELLDGLCVHYIAKKDKKIIACLLNYSMPNDAFKRRLNNDVCDKIHKILMEEFCINIETGISKAIQESKDIAYLYSETLMVFDYADIKSNSSVRCFEDFEFSKLDNLYYYPSGYEENIINCIESGNEKGVMGILSELTGKNLSGQSSNVDIKRFLFYNLLSTYKKATEKVQYNSQKINYFLNRIKKADSESADECIEELCAAMLEVCGFANEVKQSDADEIAINVERYISDNFADVNLNLNTIADCFGISRQTISKKFSAAYGKKVGDYISDVRINEGKKLLEKLNINISDAAVLVGYADSNSFIRAFKKQCGITPGQYRKNITEINIE